MNPLPYLDGGEQETEYEREIERDRDRERESGEKGMVFAFVSVMGQFFLSRYFQKGL
jgi:hypothetical protein